MAGQAVNEPEEVVDALGKYSANYSPQRPQNLPRNTPPLDYSSFRPQTSHYSSLNLGYDPVDPVFDPLSVVIPPSYHYIFIIYVYLYHTIYMYHIQWPYIQSDQFI